ncbi:MAG TPA: type II toxin-antitoxin system RelE/ParE family toxin [Rhizomicrobium sp.]|nr:type II toxin-antitoxin system RelE/ParE family toxin [Rhizomicrobium sp.]
MAKLRKAIYVLHAFMKKSKSGIGVPRQDIETVRARLQRALELDEEN